MITRPEMSEVRGRCNYGLTVVSAKKPKHWIVRGITSSWGSTDTVRKNIERLVGIGDPEIEWTNFTYDGIPSHALIDKPVIRTGIWRFDYLEPVRSFPVAPGYVQPEQFAQYGNPVQLSQYADTVTW
jgi:hypothetical protein